MPRTKSVSREREIVFFAQIILMQISVPADMSGDTMPQRATG
jgi:hypothetical protein